MINVENSYAAWYFCGENDTFFSESFDEDKSSKEQHLFDQKYCFYCHFWFI